MTSLHLNCRIADGVLAAAHLSTKSSNKLLGRQVIRLYYIVQSEMLPRRGIIEAQVIGALRARAKSNERLEARLIFLEPLRIALSRKARAALKGFRDIWPEGRISIVPYISRLGHSSPGKSLAAWLTREQFTGAEVVFHCRGPKATLSADAARRALKKGRIIFDVRGAYPYEEIHRHGYAWMENISPEARRTYEDCLEIDRQAAAVADHLFTVSDGLKRYAIEELGVAERKINTVPSCVDDLVFDEERRRQVRLEWGVSDSAPVFIYSGRLAPERLPRHMFRVFKSILRFSADAKLILFSDRNKVSDLDSLIAEAGLSHSAVIMKSYSRDEVLTRLCGADIGMLFLESALRYQGIAAPIKIAEYLSAGLSLIVNSAVGKIPDMVSDRNLGWVIDTESEDDRLDEISRRIIETFMRDRQQFRQHSLDTCSELYLWKSHFPVIQKAYGF